MTSTQEILVRAKAAVPSLAEFSDGEINAALIAMSRSLIENTENILENNRLDCENAKGKISEVMIDRLRLSAERIRAMADGILEITRLPSPLGQTLDEVVRENGLIIKKCMNA
jgi:glutamate-5-semialdehyde dehydrogenase